MGDPVLTPMLIGAGLGAATSDDPLKGAVLGGALGGVGGHFTNGFGGMFGPATPQGLAGSGAAKVANSAAFTPAQFKAALFADPTKMAAIGSGGTTNALLPGASSVMGAKTLFPATVANQAATASVNPLMAGFNKTMSDIGLPPMGGSSDSKSMLQAAALLKGSPQQQQPQPRGASAPPLNPNAGGQFAGLDPYSQRMAMEQQRLRQGLMPASSYFG